MFIIHGHKPLRRITLNFDGLVFLFHFPKALGFLSFINGYLEFPIRDLF